MIRRLEDEQSKLQNILNDLLHATATLKQRITELERRSSQRAEITERSHYSGMVEQQQVAQNYYPSLLSH